LEIAVQKLMLTGNNDWLLVPDWDVDMIPGKEYKSEHDSEEEEDEDEGEDEDEQEE